jgi:hypothetical protein
MKAGQQAVSAGVRTAPEIAVRGGSDRVSGFWLMSIALGARTRTRRPRRELGARRERDARLQAPSVVSV